MNLKTSILICHLEFFFLFQAKINHEILNSKVFSLENHGQSYDGGKGGGKKGLGNGRLKGSGSIKARSLMNLHNNEAGRRVSEIYLRLSDDVV